MSSYLAAKKAQTHFKTDSDEEAIKSDSDADNEFRSTNLENGGYEPEKISDIEDSDEDFGSKPPVKYVLYESFFF